MVCKKDFESNPENLSNVPSAEDEEKKNKTFEAKKRKKTATNGTKT